MNQRGAICTIIASNGNIYAVRRHFAQPSKFTAYITSPREEPLHHDARDLEKAFELIALHMKHSNDTLAAVLRATGFAHKEGSA